MEWTPSELFKVSGSFWSASVIHSGVYLDVFSAIKKGADNVDKVATALDCSRRGMDGLLTALGALGLIEKNGDHCALTKFSWRYLCADSPEYLGHIINHNRNLVPGWSKLSEAVRTGRPVRRRSSVTTSDEFERKSFLLGMHNMASLQAALVAEKLDLSTCKRLLDLGGGPGSYAVRFCLANPGLKATVFDLPTSRPFAEQVIRENKMTGRVNFTGGNFAKDDLPSGYDVCWLSHILHGAGEKMSRRVVKKAAKAALPGGRVLIQEFVLNNDKSGPIFPSLFNLNMLIGARDGLAFTERQLAELLREAGAVNIKRLPVDLPNGCAIICGDIV